MVGVGVASALDAFGALPSLLDEPYVVGIALIVVAIVLVGSVLLVRYLRRTPGEKFARVLDSLDSVALLMHSNPDPDAMSSALAAKTIADKQDTDVTIYYPGQIRHDENRAFETVLDVEFERIENAGGIAEEHVVIIDHNRPRDFPGAESIDPVAVVDHHPGDGSGELHTDTREDYGACASIFTEYLRDIGLEPTRVEPDETTNSTNSYVPPNVVTGLVYGVLSDTKHLTSGVSHHEFRAIEYLHAGIDDDKLQRIANPAMDAETLDIKARAISQREVQSPFAVSDVGTVSNLDAIPQAADELRRLEGISAVVVIGDKQGELRLSGRSSDDRVHMGKVLQTVVEDIPMADAGGHARMGGGRIIIEHMEGIGPGDGLSRDELKDRFFEAMSGDF